MLFKLIKLPLRVIALPIILVMLAVQVIGAFVIGLSSIVTNLLSTFFLLDAVAGWIAHGSPAFIGQVAGVGIFFLLAPQLAGWLLNRIASLMRFILALILS